MKGETMDPDEKYEESVIEQMDDEMLEQLSSIAREFFELGYTDLDVNQKILVYQRWKQVHRASSSS
jgi:hypothetical protein